MLEGSGHDYLRLFRDIGLLSRFIKGHIGFQGYTCIHTVITCYLAVYRTIWGYLRWLRYL